MSNRNELRRARLKAEEAAEELRRIEALPRRRGSTVTWSNGVVWTRRGDDHWTARSSHDAGDDTNPDMVALRNRPYSSAHVAGGTIVQP